MTTTNKTTTVKTSDLTGATLDWAVAKCEGLHREDTVWAIWASTHQYSTDWCQGGPIIEREGINVCIQHDEPGCKFSHELRWYAQLDHRCHTAYGTTPLVAAMRCYVASRLGDEVDIPTDLVNIND